MHHAKTDSEVTSSAPSSPTQSPRRAVYYVQSPSRDSHDGEKNTASFHSTPVLSPMGSPPHSHSHSSVGRESSSSRFSGSLKPNGSSRKLKLMGRSRKPAAGDKPWKDCEVIEEEGLLEDEDDSNGIPRRCYFPIFILAFILLFTFFSLVLWAASRSQKPNIVMQSIKFENFNIQSGTDASLVATAMATLNSTLTMSFMNTGSFFGVYVTSTPIDLTYYQLTLAPGNVRSVRCR